jgi:hypothetical protein
MFVPPPVVFPLENRSPVMVLVRTASSGLRMSAKIRFVLLPLIVNWCAPGPVMVNPLSPNAISPLESVIVHGHPVKLKLIVSPSAAAVIASRSDPPPESAVLVTVRVAARAWRAGVVDSVKLTPNTRSNAKNAR